MGQTPLSADNTPFLYRFYQKTSQHYPVVFRGLRFIALSFPLSALSLATHAASLTDVNALISQAVTTHPLVGAAVAEEQAAAEGVTAAKLNLFPTPSITSNYDKDDGMITRAGVRQPLWTGGKLKANVNQAIYDDKAATAYIFEQQNTVAKNTIDIWQSYIYATALQRLYLNNLKQLNEFEAMMQRRVSQGVSARIDLDLVTNRILQDQNAYQGAVQQQRIAEARLSQMIGQRIANTGVQAVPLDQMARYVKAQSADFERLAFSAGGINNPSVIKQQYQIEAAKQEVKAKQASQYPTVYAQYENLYYHKENENDGQFSLGLSYDPGAGFSNLALARASQARVKSLEQSQEAARRTVMEDIQTQYQQFASAKDQETSLVAAVAGAQIVVDSYRRQFIAGRKSWLEVLNAVREKAGYQQQLLQVQSQMLGAFYKLQVDFGRMPWQNLTPLTTPVKEFRPYIEFRDWLKQETPAWTATPFNTEPTNEYAPAILDNNSVTYGSQTDNQIDSQANTVSSKTSASSVSSLLSSWINDTIIYPSLDKVIAAQYDKYPAANKKQVAQLQAPDSWLVQSFDSLSNLVNIDGFSRYPEPETSDDYNAATTRNLSDNKDSHELVAQGNLDDAVLDNPTSDKWDAATLTYPKQMTKKIAKPYEPSQTSNASHTHDTTANAEHLVSNDGFIKYPQPTTHLSVQSNSVQSNMLTSSDAINTQVITITENRTIKTVVQTPNPMNS